MNDKSPGVVLPSTSLDDARYRILGDSGIRVSPICLGTMMFGPYGNPYASACVDIIHHAIDAGINFFDSADRYSMGEAEVILGKALKGRRDEAVVATKFTVPMSETDPNQRGHSRKWIMRAVENSLHRLGTDYIDLFQAHRPDPHTGLDELLSALSDLVHQGKVRAIGTSTFPAHAIVEAQWIAERRGRERFVSEQPPYSILARGIEADVLPVCEQFKIGVLTWSPLAGGWLSGAARRDPDATKRPRAQQNPARFDASLPENHHKAEVVDALEALATEAGLSLPELSVAFVLNHPAVTAAIIGPRTMDQLVGVLGAREVHLENDLLDRIDAIVAPGTTINQADAGYLQPSLTQAARRRRRV